MPAPDDTLLEFPCRFPIKAMGRNEDGFAAHVRELVGAHFPDVGADDIHTRNSGGGRYVPVTITVTATGKTQLDAVYYALTASERVLVAL